MDDVVSLIFTPVVVQAGLTCLAAQCLFYVIFLYVLPKGPWTELPGFTAHQAIGFPLMLYLTYEGASAWFWDFKELANAGPLVHILEVQERGKHISEVVLGMMLFWDIPVGLATPALRETLMLVHHIGMGFVSGVGAGVFSNGMSVGSYYTIFFFGVVEFSSVFLALVDLFHPKHKAWFDFLQKEGFGMLRSINEFARVAFAISFIVVRAMYFPYVQVTGALPDFSHVASLPEEERQGVSSGVLWGVFVIGALFSILQMYWGVLVARQIVKALAPSKKKKS